MTAGDITRRVHPIDRRQQLAQRHHVRSVPAMYFFADGERVEQMGGVKQRAELCPVIEQCA